MPLDPDAAEERATALLGEVLGGRYRLDAVLGIGAMGAVFRAYHTGLEREVAVKLLHRDLMASDEMRARFSREASAISKLDHPHCVRVTDFGSDDQYQYLVM
ncbi:MAG: protein kinase, partial [Myxococcales bacterium]|nr:protein kinase [Myxococcales bacterium]